MFGRSSGSAVVGRDISSGGSRAAEVVGETASELAERALAAAREAQRVATPAIIGAARDAQRVATPVLRNAAQTSAETLSHAAERAAEVLADTAERLAETGQDRGAAASTAARHKLANASEALAQAVRPKKRRRGRRALIGLAVVAGGAALARSPLRTKLMDAIFGRVEDVDDEPESITLPHPADGAKSVSPSSELQGTPQSSASASEATGGNVSNGVASETAAIGDAERA